MVATQNIVVLQARSTQPVGAQSGSMHADCSQGCAALQHCSTGCQLQCCQVRLSHFGHVSGMRAAHISAGHCPLTHNSEVSLPAQEYAICQKSYVMKPADVPLSDEHCQAHLMRPCRVLL